MTVEEFATSGAVDWEKDFIWIQNTSLLKILRRGADRLEVLRHDGVSFHISTSEAKEQYFEIRNGTHLKPIYAPYMAHILSKTHGFQVNGVDREYDAGSAILRREGIFSVVHQGDLMRDFEAVSNLSDKRFPETPFSR